MSIQHSYAADPAAVHAMMINEPWLVEVAKRTGARSWQVFGDATNSKIQAEIAAPSKVKAFTGESLRVNLEINWGPAAADGVRNGTLTANVEGLPTTITGAAVIKPGEVDGNPGTIVDYETDFTVNVPLLGPKLETAAAPHVRRIIDVQQAAGIEYLANQAQ